MDEDVKDGAYFKTVNQQVVDRLEALIKEYDPASITDASFTDEAQGRCRAAIGKARLLISKRLPQFVGLCQANLDKTGEKETTNEDLQGFWDLVTLAIEDVYSMFEVLRKAQANNWQEEAVVRAPAKSPRRVKKKTKPAASKELLEKRKAMQAQRAAMKAEMRRKAKQNRLAAIKPGSQDHIFVASSPGPQPKNANNSSASNEDSAAEPSRQDPVPTPGTLKAPASATAPDAEAPPSPGTWV